MTDPATDTVKIDGYHGHVYYTAATRALAEQLRGNNRRDVRRRRQGLER